MIRIQKLKTSLVFLFFAIFTAVIGVIAINNPKIEGRINIGHTQYVARVQKNYDFIYYKKLSSAVENAQQGQVVEIVNPVVLD